MNESIPMQTSLFTKHVGSSFQWAALALSCLLVTPSSAQTAQAANKAVAKPALTVTLVSPSTEAQPRSLQANGTIAAWQEAVIGAEVSGLRVAKLHAQVGDRVRKGQVLATFARDTVLSDLRLAEAAVLEARANADEAKADATRGRNLQGSGSLSEQQIQQLLTREQAALAKLTSTQAQLSMQQLRLSQTTVKAPDDGIISARQATIGSVLNPGTEMFRLIRQGRLEWRGEFSAAELEDIRAGQTVRIMAPSGVAWLGRVRMTAPTVDPVSRRGLAYVDIQSPEEKGATPLRPGSYVRGDLTIGSQAGLFVPQSAVVARDGFHLVFAVSDGLKVTQKKVRIGRLVGTRQEILSGITAQDKLVASGGAFLSDGDTVRLASSAPARPTK